MMKVPPVGLFGNLWWNKNLEPPHDCRWVVGIVAATPQELERLQFLALHTWMQRSSSWSDAGAPDSIFCQICSQANGDVKEIM